MSRRQYDTAVSQVIVEHDVPCSARDGTVLRADVYRPRAAGRYPVLLCRTPYEKSSGFFAYDAPQLARLGYIVAVQDCRGRGASDGEYQWTYGFPGSAIEPLDGYDSVEWAATLEGSTGKVGMFGHSYSAGLAMGAAAEQPPSLAAIFPSGMTDTHSNMTHGVFETGRRLQWVFGMAADARRRAGDPFMPHRREAADEVWANVDRHKWIWQLPLASLPYEFASTLTPQLQRYFEEVHLDVWDFRPDHGRIKVPTATVTGWWDRLVNCINNFIGMSDLASTDLRADHRLMIGPWGHTSAEWHGHLGPRDYGAESTVIYHEAVAGWFDQHLKGMEPAQKERVSVFILNENRWVGFDSWPVEGAVPTPFFMDSQGKANGVSGDGTLVEMPVNSEPDRFTYDPRDPVMSLMAPDSQAAPRDQSPLDRRRDILVYQTAPLERDLLCIGPVKLHLWASSSAPDTDFTAKLIEVGPDGLAVNLSHAIKRARYRNGFDNPALLDSDAPVQYVIDMMPVGIRFRKGSRIRLDISSSDFPNFDRNHNTGKDYWTDDEFKVANQVVFHDANMPSHIELPVIPDL
ncbi:MAG: CocE/NonD family hydrolase [Nitratireductor sp.]|nr:CocE/NonD family hydrolase [Nitratireductor sp.]